MVCDICHKFEINNSIDSINKFLLKCKCFINLETYDFINLYKIKNEDIIISWLLLILKWNKYFQKCLKYKNFVNKNNYY